MLKIQTLQHDPTTLSSKKYECTITKTIIDDKIFLIYLCPISENGLNF